MKQANRESLTALGNMVNVRRIRRYKRSWWTLWLGWRDENDAELRARIIREIYPYIGVCR